MKIGLDFNGVVKNTPKILNRYVKDNFGIDLPCRSCNKATLLANGLSLDQYRQTKHAIYDTPLALETEPEEGAVTRLRRIVVAHEVAVVTGMLPSGYNFGRQWLDRLDLCEVELICLPDGVKKTEVLQGFEIYADDEVSRLEEVAQIVPHVYLYGQSYSDELMHDFPTVENWPSLENEVRSLEWVAA